MKNQQLRRILIGSGVGVLALFGVAALGPSFAQDASKTTIDDIYVSDVANNSGYVLKSKDGGVSSKVNKIYATVLLGSAVENQKIIATLYSPDKNFSIGPVVAKVGTTADNTMEAFSFTTTPPWPKGQYTVDVSLENGATKSVTFNVGD